MSIEPVRYSASLHAEAIRPVLSLLGPVLVGVSIVSGQDHLSTFLLSVLVITALDVLLPEAEGVTGRAGSRLATLLPHLHLPVHALLLVCAVQLWGEPSTALIERIGMAVGFGMYGCAFGINVAHELIHRRARFSRIWGGLTLSLVCYGSFKVEHIHGHHRHVATPEDASTAPRGRGFWSHLPRAVVGNVQTALRTDRRETLGWLAVSVVVALLIGAVWGLSGVGFFVLQSLMAIFAMELTNYVEHYGLERRRLPGGHYEPVRPRHSWSTPVRFSNALFFNVQRHAHHHARPGVTYERLRHIPDSPTLPTGYPAMMLLAMVPPLWRRVVDPRLSPG